MTDLGSGHLDSYARYVGRGVIADLRKQARPLVGKRIVEVNSARRGGGVAALLASLTALKQDLGLTVDRYILNAEPGFFQVTKKIHNALQSSEDMPTAEEQRLYEEVVARQAGHWQFDHDLVTVHDPQPLPLVTHYRKHQPWLWRCHLDMSAPNERVWQYVRPFVECYDGVILSLPEYRQDIAPPQFFFMPAIDPLLLKNQPMPKEARRQVLAKYRIPTDLPLVVQVSRFDRWKDPLGVLAAFQLVRRQTRCRLVLLGNFVADDPESQEVYEKIKQHASDDVLILTAGDDEELVRALQQEATVVVQKSLREGFGLTVTEAMWQSQPVVGGSTAGIRAQIEEGRNGFLAATIDEAADHISQLLKQSELRRELGQRAHETVRQHFLMTRLLAEEINLMSQLLS